MSNKKGAWRGRVFALGVASLFVQGCGVMNPEPKPLYPDGPELTGADAAVVNLLAFADVPQFNRPIAWAATEIIPQFTANSLGEQQLPSTWIVTMPPGEYLFRFQHPCEWRTSQRQTDDGRTVMVTHYRSVYVDVSVTLAPGRFYRAVFRDRPGIDDFEVRETSEEIALRFNPPGQRPPCNLDVPTFEIFEELS